METKGITIEITKEKKEEIFYNALCNGLGYIGGYGLELEYDENDYQKAKKSYLSRGTAPCYEDVLMEILRNGDSLIFNDVEGDGDQTRSITMDDVYTGILKTPVRDLMDMIEENDDACTADAVIQSVLYGELIFG